jgi:MGT family glycosyltransferase
MDAVRGQNINLFATLGKNNSPESLGPLPDNVRVAQYVPQSLVLPKVAAVICNGGSGVTMGTILAQKPMVIVPMISDQPENARRCEFLGLAKMLPQKKLNKENAWRAIQAVMQEPRFRLRAEEVGRAFAEFKGAENGASLLEELARTRKPVLQD